jgi:hypothetical protein
MSSKAYQVEKILNKKLADGKLKYKVKWAGYPTSQCTWEPLENLSNVLDMVAKYENKATIDSPKNRYNTYNFNYLNRIASSSRSRSKSQHKKRIKVSSVKKDNKKNRISNIKKYKEEIVPFASSDEDITYGSIEFDRPERMLSAKMTGSAIKCLVEWRTRYDGTKPENSFVFSKELKKNCPELLIEFYESLLKH